MAISDFWQYSSFPVSSSVVATQFAITPSDSNQLAIRPRFLYCNAAGNAVVVDAAGTSVTYALTQGQILPIRAVQIKATGTTATLIGWY